jgi:plastocyanin
MAAFPTKGDTLTAVRIAVAAAVASAVLLVVTGVAGAASPKKLTATVGPGFTITLVDSSGKKVTRLKAGAYVITVRDLSSEHNFELRGGGLVEQETSVPGTGTVKWTLVLKKGAYTYVCDPHASTMRGSFVVS